MADNNQQTKAVKHSEAQGANTNRQGGDSSNRPKGRFPRRDSRGRPDNRRDEFEQRILEIARVTRVMAGGKRMSFRACVAIGDKKGGVSVALGKGSDVTIAVNKAVNKAKKNMIRVPLKDDSIPHEIRQKFGAAQILLKPAKQGRGVIAGGVVRVILELAGVKNATSKILGTNNKINNARCTILALSNLRSIKSDFPAPLKDDKKDQAKNDNKSSLK